MLNVLIQSSGEPDRSLEVQAFPCIIGRESDVAWNLKSWRVAKKHARLALVSGNLSITDLGSLAGTWVNGERVSQYGPLQESDEIGVAGYRIKVQAIGNTVPLKINEGNKLKNEILAVADEVEAGKRSLLQMGKDASIKGQYEGQDLEIYWRRKLHAALLETIDLRRHDIRLLGNEALRDLVIKTLTELLEKSESVPTSIDRASLILEVCHEAIGLGPLEHLMHDDAISEIMVNGLSPIFVERYGKLEQTNLRFSNPEAIRSVIDRIVSPIGRRIDESSPMVDARLEDGSRVNAVIAPLAVSGTSITIRRFNKRVLSPEDLVRLGSASPAMLEFLRLCVSQRLNIVVSGGTGSGKTTLLNLLSSMIFEDERIVTIEDAAELKLIHRNLVSLEARPSNAEGRGQILIRDLVKNALRMRPDRIVVGECRGGEALDMLQAMNTGHDGSLTTVHANTPRDVVSRLEVMVLMAGLDIPVQAIREQIVSAVDLVVHQARFPDGTRRITEICEITGMEGPRVLMQSIFGFQRGRSSAKQGTFQASGHLPQFLEEFRERSVEFNLDWFKATS